MSLPKRWRVSRYRDHADRITDVCAHPRRDVIASVDQRGSVVIRDLDDPSRTVRGKVDVEPTEDPKRWIALSLEFTPDGDHLLVQRGRKGLAVLRTSDGSLLQQDGAGVVASASQGHGAETRVWFVRDGRLHRAPIQGLDHADSLGELGDFVVRRISIRANGSSVALSSDSEVALWDVDSLRLVWRRRYPVDEPGDRSDPTDLIQVGWEGDRILAISRQDSRAALYDIATGEISERPFCDSKDAWDHAFSSRHAVSLTPSVHSSQVWLSSRGLSRSWSLDVPDAGPRLYALALLRDEDAVAVTDAASVFVIPLDMAILSLKGDALQAHVTSRLAVQARPESVLRAAHQPAFFHRR
jgi:WD40 repeat protein